MATLPSNIIPTKEPNTMKEISSIISMVDSMLPDEYDLEISDDKMELVISCDEFDEAIGVIRYTNDIERAGDFGSEFALTVIYSGPKDEVTTTWYTLESAINFYMGQCQAQR